MVKVQNVQVRPTVRDQASAMFCKCMPTKFAFDCRNRLEPCQSGSTSFLRRRARGKPLRSFSTARKSRYLWTLLASSAQDQVRSTSLQTVSCFVGTPPTATEQEKASRPSPSLCCSRRWSQSTSRTSQFSTDNSSDSHRWHLQNCAHNKCVRG